MAPIATTQVSPQTTESFKKPHQALANLPQRPVERLWRGNKSGSVRLNGVPDFNGDKYAERQHIKEHMVCLSLFHIM
jgi:hypothetical protein